MCIFCNKNGKDGGSCKGVGAHTLMRTLFGILVVFVIFFVGTLISNNIKRHSYIGKADRAQNTIAVNGEGKEIGTPNIAVTDIGLVTEKADVASAQKENTDKMNKLISEVKKKGIKDADIQTSNYSVYPKYDYTNGKSNISGYSVNQTVTLKIRDLNKISDVLAKVGEVGVNQVNSLNFTIDDTENLRAAAREKALISAQEKALTLAKDLGVKLVRVVSYNEYVPTDAYTVKSYPMAAGMGGGVSAPAPDIQSGSLDVKVDVTVIYEIE